MVSNGAGRAKLIAYHNIDHASKFQDALRCECSIVVFMLIDRAPQNVI
jgi:hypothetical protein